ncbi:MAG: hypothetical protein ACRDZ4_13245 [Egibacteraceae bacterium]
MDGLIRASLGELSTEAEERWRAEFVCALISHGRDVEELGRTVDVERVLDVFSAAFWDELTAAAVKDDSPLAPLWTHAVLSRILGRLDAGHLPHLSADEVRDRLTDYLRQVEAHARDRPSLAPERFDLDALHQRVRISTGLLRPRDRAYLPKGAHKDDEQATIGWWTAVRDRHPRLVVLGEPGYGKTWLLRHEAQQLAVAGTTELDRGEHPEQVRVPVWLRLDELAAALPVAATWEQLPETLVRALRSHHRLSPLTRALAGAAYRRRRVRPPARRLGRGDGQARDAQRRAGRLDPRQPRRPRAPHLTPGRLHRPAARCARRRPGRARPVLIRGGRSVH